MWKGVVVYCWVIGFNLTVYYNGDIYGKEYKNMLGLRYANSAKLKLAN